MKTVQYTTTNELKRLNDVDADRATRASNCNYVPKSAWKAITREPKAVVEETNVEKTVSEKQLSKKKDKKHVK